MLLYLIPFLFICYGIITYDINGRNKGKTLLWVCIFIYFTLLIGLRYKVGGDTIVYMGDYNWRGSLEEWKFNFIDRFQPGYTFLCAIGKSISPDFYVFQLIHAVILNCALSIWIYKNTQYIYTAFMTFFLSSYLYFSTEVLREALAVIIFLFNYKNLIKRRWIIYYLGVLLSCCFHFSALILLILPFCRNIKFNKVYVFLIICSIGVSVFSARIIHSLSVVMTVAEKAEGYAGETIGIMAGTYKLLTNAIFPIGFGYISTYKQKKEIKYEWMVGIMGLLGIMSVFNTILFGRFSNYFIIFFCVSFGTTIIQWIKSKSKIYRHNALVLASCFIMIFGIGFKMYNRYTLWIPYYSIFNPVEVKREYADKMLLNK